MTTHAWYYGVASRTRKHILTLKDEFNKSLKHLVTQARDTTSVHVCHTQVRCKGLMWYTLTNTGHINNFSNETSPVNVDVVLHGVHCSAILILWTPTRCLFCVLPSLNISCYIRVRLKHFCNVLFISSGGTC